MNVFVEPSSYHLGNAGDSAMMVESLRRLSIVLPDVQLHVATEKPSRLAALCAHAEPVCETLALRNAICDLPRSAPSSRLQRRIERARGELSLRLDDFRPQRTWEKFRRRISSATGWREWCDFIGRFHAVVVTGGGFITDSHWPHARRVFCTAEAAYATERPVVFFGQGVGPLQRRSRFLTAKQILCRAEFVGLREPKEGPQLLQHMELNRSRFAVTGDDALSLAHRSTPSLFGERLGFNIRKSGYSAIDDQVAARCFAALEKLQSELRVEVQPIAITANPGESDVKTLEQMPTSIGRLSVNDCLSPDNTVHRIGTCRVVITGSYHAAVFALGQGVSVVGLAANRYYQSKFEGLRKLFGEACSIVALDATDFEARIQKHVHERWRAAPDCRQMLRRATTEQVAACNEAYAKLPRILGTGTRLEA